MTAGGSTGNSSIVPVNAAIVGLGRWGKNLVGAVQGKSQRIRFVRGMVRHPAAVQDFADQHGFALTDDFDALLADPAVQALVLATPPGQHTEHIVAAAKAGKAVFCEKPLALTRARAQQAVDACAAAGVALGVGQDKRFWPSMQELKRVVAGGSLGTLLHVEGNFSNENSNATYTAWRSSPTESPGGSLTATGIHVLDAFVNLMGPVRSVQAHNMARQATPTVQDTSTIFFEFSDQATGVLTSVRPTPLFFRVQVFGSRGWAQARGATELEIQLSGQALERRQFEPVDALRFEMEAFADAVAGRAAYPVSPEQIVMTAATLEAAVRAVDFGGVVELSSLS
jgi:predicted dehydrogenase